MFSTEDFCHFVWREVEFTMVKQYYIFETAKAFD